MKPDLRPGLVAISKKGRDKGRPLMVLYQLDADFVLVADGRTRRVDHPKKKRCKHLVATSREMPGILSLYEAKRLTDSELRKALTPVETQEPTQPEGGPPFVQE